MVKDIIFPHPAHSIIFPIYLYQTHTFDVIFSLQAYEWGLCFQLVSKESPRLEFLGVIRFCKGGFGDTLYYLLDNREELENVRDE